MSETLSLSEAIARSMAAAEVTVDEDLDEVEEEEEETEQVLRCVSCEAESPTVVEHGRGYMSATGEVENGRWGLTIETWDTDYEWDETTGFECQECGHEEPTLEALIEIVDLPVDR